jgi:hypothetical protein
MTQGHTWAGLAFCAAAWLLAAGCSGGTPANNAVSAPSLEGTASDVDDVRFDLPDGPTAAHTALLRLLPRTKAMVPDSVRFGAWDAAGASFVTSDALGDAIKQAPMPGLTARYAAKGFTVIGAGGKDDSMDQALPQQADLFVIEAPEEMAARAIQKQLVDTLTRAGFETRPPVVGVRGSEEAQVIERMFRVDTREELIEGRKLAIEYAHSAYLVVIGARLCYALETETRKPLIGPKGEVIPLRPGDLAKEQAGSRLGAQLILLTQDAAARKP